jgi:hypothetical protein
MLEDNDFWKEVMLLCKKFDNYYYKDSCYYSERNDLYDNIDNNDDMSIKKYMPVIEGLKIRKFVEIKKPSLI